MIINSFMLALRELKRNALRSFLTMLGIIIGVASVIILVTLGSGATLQVTDEIASLGSNLLIVSLGKRLGPGQTSGASAFKLDDAEAIANEVPDIVGVAPNAGRSLTVVVGNENWVTSVTGSTEAYFSVNNRELTKGRSFTAGDARRGASVCVIGDTVRRELFGALDPIGEKVRLGNLSCEVIGLLEAKGQSTVGTDQDDLIILPLRTFQRRIAGHDDLNLIQVSFAEGASTERVQDDIRRLLRSRRHLSGNEDDDFSVLDMKEISSMLTGTTRLLTGLLGAVAAVSLLVGGVGIMNILLVSVTERTREIGTRLAIGALEREVLLQFLVEAVVLSSLGGLIGIGFALGVSAVLAGMLQVPFVPDYSIIVIAFLFSAGVGVVFGFVPARKAARLDPIEALRYE